MTDKSHLRQEEVSVFCVELTNMDLDEKRERRGLINYTHIVSRNTSREIRALVPAFENDISRLLCTLSVGHL